jgi:LysR family hydrogen peroxide-inducible transcriptional activator
MVELDRAVDQVADLARADQETLRIGILAPLGPGLLDDLLRSLLAAAPDVTLEMAEGDVCEHLDALARGRLDVAFVPGQAVGQRFDVHRAWREHLLAALPMDDALAAQHSVRWREIIERKLLLPAGGRRDLEALIARRVRRLGGAARMAPQLAGHATVLRLAALGQGVALVPESCAPRVNGVVYRPIHREILAYNAIIGRRPPKPVLRRLLGLIERT